MLYSNYLYNLEPKTKAIILIAMCIIAVVGIVIENFTRDKEV